MSIGRERRQLGSLLMNPDLDKWVEVRADNTVIVRTGKAELGQGIRTAIAAIAADELRVHPSRIVVQGAATGIAPNEGVTAGSGSIEGSGAAVRQACAYARRLLVERAAAKLGIAAAALTVDDGVVVAPDGIAFTYAELAASGPFDFKIDAPATDAGEHREWVGRGLPRVDLPAKIRGEPAFVHDFTLPGMRHARVIRPPRPGAALRQAGAAPPGVDVVQRGSFLAVVADREADAVRGAEVVARECVWEGGGVDAGALDPISHLRTSVGVSVAVVDGAVTDASVPPAFDHAGAAAVVRATYTKPFVMHGSIGPSAAVARFDGERLELWSHSQGVEVLRLATADIVGLPREAVAVTHVDGAGCYGHNGADDAGADAALVAMAAPGRAVSLKWTRGDEHGWEPLSPAMVIELEAALDDGGRVRSWQHEVFTYPHGARPRPQGGGTSGLLPSWYLEEPWSRPSAGRPRGFHSGGHRNADPLYDFADRRIVEHFVPDSPLRTSSTRGLGAFGNVFAIESFVDELAHAAGADPVAFRLAHLQDPRAREVIEAAVDLAGGLEAPGGVDAPGRGLAFARYENIKTYVALVVEVEVVARTGEIRLRRGWIAADAGQVIDPDGLANQLEGGFVQAASWTLKEQVGFDSDGVTTRDWESYPILRFRECPEVTTRIIDRPSERSLGAGEATTGPTPAAIANAVFQATGARLRDLPMTPDKVKGALAALL